MAVKIAVGWLEALVSCSDFVECRSSIRTMRHFMIGLVGSANQCLDFAGPPPVRTQRFSAEPTLEQPQRRDAPRK